MNWESAKKYINEGFGVKVKNSQTIITKELIDHYGEQSVVGNNIDRTDWEVYKHDKQTGEFIKFNQVDIFDSIPECPNFNVGPGKEKGSEELHAPLHTNMDITEFTTRWMKKAADIPGRMELLFDQVRNVSEKVEELVNPNVDLNPTDEWPENGDKELIEGTWDWALNILLRGDKIRLPEWLGYWFKHEEGWTASFTRHGEIVQAWLDRGYQGRDDWEEAHGLSFEWALTALKAGKRVRRRGWNGKGMYIWMMPEMKVPKEWIKEHGLLDACNAGNGEYVHCEPAIRIFTAQKTVSTGWRPTNLDMFANDWELAE